MRLYLPRPFSLQQHIELLKSIDVNSQLYILQTSEMYDKTSVIATGTAQLTIPIKSLRATTTPCPNITEQVEIAHILDGLFAKEQHDKEDTEAVLD